jgi:hypothetical protein
MGSNPIGVTKFGDVAQSGERQRLQRNDRHAIRTSMAKWKYNRVVPPKEYVGPLYMGRYCLEHHLVWWQHHRTTVPKGYVLHHKNEDPRDNRIENLELLTSAEHSSRHAAHKTEAATVEMVCGNCGRGFTLVRSKVKTRLKQSLSGSLFCSQQCGALKQHTTQQRDISHGTVVAYSYHKCRCELCKRGQRERARLRRIKSKELGPIG